MYRSVFKTNHITNYTANYTANHQTQKPNHKAVQKMAGLSFLGLALTLTACNATDIADRDLPNQKLTEPRLTAPPTLTTPATLAADVDNRTSSVSATASGASGTSGASGASGDDRPISLSIPIDCQLGDDCFVMLYPDVDPSSGIRDFGCGQQTYDTHKGTDFAVPSLADLERGVDVLAAADGTVLRLRDGVPDRRLRTAAEIEAIAAQGIECGNGIMIDHGDGWTGQYCHMAQGSIAVREGDRVQRGEVLGRVGVSGKTTFPHVHLTVRHNDEVVDPYTGKASAAGCDVDRQPIWSEGQDYEPTGIVRIGFADTPPTIDQLWDGEFTAPLIDTQADVLLFWAHYYGAQAGDIERYRLLDGSGRVVTEYEQEVKTNQVNGMSYVGKRNTPQNPIVPGTWRGEYSLVRAGKVIASQVAELEVRSAN